MRDEEEVGKCFRKCIIKTFIHSFFFNILLLILVNKQSYLNVCGFSFCCHFKWKETEAINVLYICTILYLCVSLNFSFLFYFLFFPIFFTFLFFNLFLCEKNIQISYSGLPNYVIVEFRNTFTTNLCVCSYANTY